jgi:hypothetical protein
MSDRSAIAIVVAAGLLYLSWIAFNVWVITKLVIWLTSK